MYCGVRFMVVGSTFYAGNALRMTHVATLMAAMMPAISVTVIHQNDR